MHQRGPFVVIERQKCSLPAFMYAQTHRVALRATFLHNGTNQVDMRKRHQRQRQLE